LRRSVRTPAVCMQTRMAGIWMCIFKTRLWQMPLEDCLQAFHPGQTRMPAKASSPTLHQV